VLGSYALWVVDELKVAGGPRRLDGVNPSFGRFVQTVCNRQDESPEVAAGDQGQRDFVEGFGRPLGLPGESQNR
jgi:hypothetical protein